MRLNSGKMITSIIYMVITIYMKSEYLSARGGGLDLQGPVN
jgi:hypothetical protein